ncbi:MAG: hypothetical protein KA712_00260 [Myxococcales bacterium]|nr:hypothetical protein [Myxococcales bacterium]
MTFVEIVLLGFGLDAAAGTQAATLELRGCRTPGHETVTQLVAQEAQARRLPPEAVSFTVTCGDTVRLDAYRPRDGARASREVDLHGLDEAAHPRVLALSATEMLEALALPAPVAVQTTPAPARVRAAWRVAATSGLEHLGGALGWIQAFGGELTYQREGRSLGWEALGALTGHASSREIKRGEGHARGLRWDTWLMLRRRWSHGAWLAGAGARLAATHFEGEAALAGDVGRSFWSTGGGPLLGLGAEWLFRQGMFVQLRYELGHNLVGSAGLDEEGRDLAMEGLWHGPRLSVGWAPARR